MSKWGEKLRKICPYCGVEFEYTKSMERKYCSKECANLAKRTGMDIVCDNCGKTFHRRQYHIDRQKNRGQNNFCCTNCQKEYLHKQRFEIRYCEICGKEFEVSKLNTQRFCSDECQNKWQTTIIGKLNPRFTSVLTPCTYCGKLHYVKPYKFDMQESFFCSVECRRSWYAETYSQRNEWKEESRQRALRELRDGSFNVETMPQKIVNGLLDNLNINYRREEAFTYYAVDNYLYDSNLIIEVQGDYWHANPLKFISELNEVQYKRINRDKSKHTYFANQYDIEILYLWENDIVLNPILCCELIKLYVGCDGILEDYHSFNYEMIGDVLSLKKDKMIPYQNMDLDKYQFMLKIS